MLILIDHGHMKRPAEYLTMAMKRPSIATKTKLWLFFDTSHLWTEDLPKEIQRLNAWRMGRFVQHATASF
jgi:hypothetical protein